MNDLKSDSKRSKRGDPPQALAKQSTNQAHGRDSVATDVAAGERKPLGENRGPDPTHRSDSQFQGDDIPTTGTHRERQSEPTLVPENPS